MAKADWMEAKDKNSGRTYFYNRVTKKTQWKRPAEMDEPAAAAPVAATPVATAPAAAVTALNPEDDPKNWRKVQDPKTGKSYYYNSKTKQTRWKPPPCLESSTPSAGAASAAATPSATVAVTSTPAPITAASTTSTSAAAVPAAAADPGPWVEAKDPKSGRSYWFNKSTRKTTWKNPHKVAEAPKPALPSAKPPSLPSSTPPSAGSPVGTAGPIGETPDGASSAQMLKVKQAMQENNKAEEEAEEETNDEDDEGFDFRFAKHRKGWLNRTFRVGEVQDDTTMMTFKKSMIKKALLKQNRDLDEAAVQAFKNVMSYMGDRKSSKVGVDHAKKMLRNLMIAPAGLRDEVYMQLCKQTTGNPRVDSCEKGWELMVFCLATFPPSKHLKGFLLDYIQKTVTNTSNAPEQKRIHDLAENACQRLPRIVKMGQRKQPPGRDELESLKKMQPMQINVKLVNGTFKTFLIDPYTLVEDLQGMLFEAFNLTCRTPFAIYEQAEANEERILELKERVADVVAGWENGPLIDEIEVDDGKKAKTRGKYADHKDANKKVEKKVIKYKDLVFKAKLVLKTNNKEVMEDPEAVNLIYLQAVSDVVTNRYPSNQKDLTVLAALQLQATFGNYRPDTHTRTWLGDRLLEFIPKYVVIQQGKVSVALKSEWIVKVLAKWQKIQNFEEVEAKINYLDYVQEWVFYGSTLFQVEQRQFKEYPSPLFLGINCEGVMLQHPDTRTVVENYQFTDVVTWGHSDEKFIVVVGNIVQQRKLIFKTVEGKHMNQLIHDYVKFKVKYK